MSDVGVQADRKALRTMAHMLKCNLTLNFCRNLFNQSPHNGCTGRNGLHELVPVFDIRSTLQLVWWTAESRKSFSWKYYLCVLPLLWAINECLIVRSLLPGFAKGSRALETCDGWQSTHHDVLRTCKNAICSVLWDFIVQTYMLKHHWLWLCYNVYVQAAPRCALQYYSLPSIWNMLVCKHNLCFNQKVASVNYPDLEWPWEFCHSHWHSCSVDSAKHFSYWLGVKFFEASRSSLGRAKSAFLTHKHFCESSVILAQTT